MDRASSNWRRNLRRAARHAHSVDLWVNPQADRILAVYAAMQSYKDLPEQVSPAELASLLETFGDNCLVVKYTDAAGTVQALRGALLFGDKAWDTFAAATPEARKVYASYAAFWTLMQECARRGVRWYDMGGVDPEGNRGVFNFKKGTGARELVYVGEWDRATLPGLRPLANLALRYRAQAF
jgi:lipid II:glycine glycyltransferase (peptidoglycan interpeptide bridge formation enzyme)